MKSLYRKVFTEKKNPGCHGKYYKKMQCRSKNYINKYIND